MKRMKMTFWLLGFGCGIVLSGIVATVCTLNINEYKMNLVETTAGKVDVPQKSARKEETFVSTPVVVEQKEENKQVQIEQSLSGPSVEPSQDNHEEIIQKQIFIPTDSNSSDICGILENEGIIDSAEEFNSYIREKKKTTQLKDGYVTCTINASYEELLAELVIN